MRLIAIFLTLFIFSCKTPSELNVKLKPVKGEGSQMGVVSFDHFEGKFRYKRSGYRIAIRDSCDKLFFDSVCTVVAITRKGQPFRLILMGDVYNQYSIGSEVGFGHTLIIPHAVSKDGRLISLRFSPRY